MACEVVAAGDWVGDELKIGVLRAGQEGGQNRLDGLGP